MRIIQAIGYQNIKAIVIVISITIIAKAMYKIKVNDQGTTLQKNISQLMAVDSLMSCLYWNQHCQQRYYKYDNFTLQWRHNVHDGVSNHQPYDCLLNRLFRRTSKKISKLRVTDLCEGNSPVNSPHKGPVTRRMFSFDDVIMQTKCLQSDIKMNKQSKLKLERLRSEDAPAFPWLPKLMIHIGSKQD